jgi:hypothetical protein
MRRSSVFWAGGLLWALLGCQAETADTGSSGKDAGVQRPDANPDDRDDDGYTLAEGDCDDTNARVRPGQREICGDDIDQDCDGNDPPCDDDRDGFTEDDGDCDDTTWAIRPGALETCDDGVDQDCNGADLRCNEVDNDGDGWSAAEGDCDDTKLFIYPGAPDRCGDGNDDDCDGADALCPDQDADGDGIDDDADLCPSQADPFQSDLDGDGVGDFCDNCIQTVNADQADGDLNGLGDACDGAVDADMDGFTGAMGDCNDDDETAYPGAPDPCDDAVDQDCNGFPDDGCPSDLRSRLIAVPGRGVAPRQPGRRGRGLRRRSRLARRELRRDPPASREHQRLRDGDHRGQQSSVQGLRGLRALWGALHLAEPALERALR